MGLLEPQHIILLFILLLIFIFPFTIWGYFAGRNRTVGGGGGLLLGLFLGFIGIIIVYCTSRTDRQVFINYNNISAADELKKYKDLLDSGAITEAEYNLQKSRILNN
jgi:Short C-terminal domain